MNKEDANKISIEDATRLKHELNKDIKYGSEFKYNAKQIEELKHITPEQQDELSDNLSFIAKHWWFIPNYLWVIGGILGVISFLFFDYRIIKYTALVFGMYCFAQIFFRSGFVDGYAEGFMGGNESAVDKILGLTLDDVADIEERSTEMELDERLIERMDMDKEESWYYVKDKKRVGPVHINSISDLIINGIITIDTLVWKEGMKGWQQAQSSDLKRYFSRHRFQREKANRKPHKAIISKTGLGTKIIGILVGIVVFAISSQIIVWLFRLIIGLVWSASGQSQALVEILKDIDAISNIGSIALGIYLAYLTYKLITKKKVIQPAT